MADEKSPQDAEAQARRDPASPVEAGDEAGARHTPGGAPTDAAHQDAGDGTLTGSVPAGLSVAELKKGASTAGRDDAGSE